MAPAPSPLSRELKPGGATGVPVGTVSNQGGCGTGKLPDCPTFIVGLKGTQTCRGLFCSICDPLGVPTCSTCPPATTPCAAPTQCPVTTPQHIKTSAMPQNFGGLNTAYGGLAACATFTNEFLSNTVIPADPPSFYRSDDATTLGKGNLIGSSTPSVLMIQANDVNILNNVALKCSQQCAINNACSVYQYGFESGAW